MLTFRPGTHINQAAALLAAEAKVNGRARARFNGIDMAARRGDVASDIVARYEREIDDRRRAWEQSPEGIAAAAKEAAEIAAAQAEHDALMDNLPQIDLREPRRAISWLGRIYPLTDDARIKRRPQEIIDALTAAGWVQNDCCGVEFDEHDRMRFARWLIGQALDGLALHGAIHPVFGTFQERWMKRFGPGWV